MEQKFQNLFKLAYPYDGNLLTGTAAITLLPQLDLPTIPKAPQLTMWKSGSVYPWRVYKGVKPDDADQLNMRYECIYILNGEPLYITMAYSALHWAELNIEEYRIYNPPGVTARWEQLTPGYDAIMASIDIGKINYLDVLKQHLVLIGQTVVLDADGRKVVTMMPVPEDHSLFNKQWKGFVDRTIYITDYEIKIATLLKN